MCTKQLKDVTDVYALVSFLKTKGENHKCYYHYTSWDSFLKIYENASFLLTRGNSLNINDQHEALMKGSWSTWNRTYIGSFAYGQSENMAMWGLYLLCNNTQKLKTVNIHGLKGVDTTPQMTGYIKNAAWRYENEVRIRAELPYSVGKEKIMIKIPDYVLSAITVMEGPSFVYKTDDICKLLHSQYRIAESAFTGLLKYRSLCSLCAHGAFEKK